MSDRSASVVSAIGSTVSRSRAARFAARAASRDIVFVVVSLALCDRVGYCVAPRSRVEVERACLKWPASLVAQYAACADVPECEGHDHVDGGRDVPRVGESAIGLPDMMH